ncbi:MAG: alpha/beta hydrolase [Gammaproteobacteria bacterium]|nr:MAG: alpha/beta hydrolase [Gammaproteobacteria bacterium]
MTASIVAIHGLWMNGMEMALLRRRLRDTLGWACSQFSYRSVGCGLAHNVDRLKQFIDAQPADQVHIVAHSLGGVLALQMLLKYPDTKVGRVVCLGSPLLGSRAASRLLSRGWGRQLIGRTLREALFDHPLGRCDAATEVAVIAGTTSFGLGRLIMRLDHPNDGVVTSAETQLPGLAGHIEMRVNHFGLVLSSAVAEQGAHFLRTGRFSVPQTLSSRT